jgi:hypothetical protein
VVSARGPELDRSSYWSKSDEGCKLTEEEEEEEEEVVVVEEDLFNRLTVVPGISLEEGFITT